jgi:predicted lipoprotein
MACRRSPTRSEALAGLILEVVAPNTRALVPASAALSAATAAFAAAPSSKALAEARESWRRAALAWKTASLFPQGPLVESRALLRATYWPVLPAAIDELLARSSPLDPRGIEDLSLNRRGLYALEYLLFPEEGDETQVLRAFSAEHGERRRQLVSGLAHDLARHAERASTLLGDGRAFAERFERGGQQSVSQWLGLLIVGIESLVVQRVESILIRADQARSSPSRVEGGPSSSSHLLLQNVLAGVEQLYRAKRSGGLAVQLHGVAKAIAERVELAFGGARSAVNGLSEPLERLASRDPQALKVIATTNRALEKVLKVDAASALGVTLTFQAGDGD